MTIDRQRVREIFFEAMERPPDERPAYVDEACGDSDDLRSEVASLLAHHDDTPLLEEPEVEPFAALPTLLSGPPSARFGKQDAPRYRTLGELGAGGFGEVVRRFDRSLRRVVACKSPHHGETACVAALLSEARLLAYLDHPGVVQVYDLREDETGVSYTMELLEGESLSQRLGGLGSATRQMPISEALRITSRVCETVANAHDKGVLHLDIKPANVMLQPYGQVSLIDWGMARFYDPEPYRSHLARSGETCAHALEGGGLSGGTPGYMPPEQFDPSASLGPAADIYAIGTLLFELLSGRRPFEEHERGPGLRAEKLRGAPSVRDARSEVSERLAGVCARMLAPSPDDRPATLDEVLDDLAALTDIGGGTQLVRLAPGEQLFEQGAASTTAYLIVAGELEIVVDYQVVAKRRAGDVVGELAMLSRGPRSATVRAGSTTTVVRAIDWAALEDELSKVDPLVGHLLRNLSDKLVETTRGA